MSKINSRQEELLTLVIESHINLAEPVGSKFLAYEEKVGWSEATIRNDLRALEEAGFLTHPHTSAGRVPTEAGYRHYVSGLDRGMMKLGVKEESVLNKIFKDNGFESNCKAMAKEVARWTNEAVIMAFDLDRIYYTGLSNLFNKPEFALPQMVINTSRMFDQCEECLGRFFEKVSEQPDFYIGTDHPFGGFLSLVACRAGKNKQSLFMVFGPTRMNYKKNFAVVNGVRKFL